MALNFPNSPTVGEIYSYGGKSWRWDGGSWAAVSYGPSIAAFTVSDIAPASASQGRGWFDSTNGQLNVYYVEGTSSQWISTNGNGVIVNFTSPGPIGTVTPNTGSFTRLSDSIGDVRLIPQNIQTASYTCSISDVGKHVFHPSEDASARGFLIPANSAVPYPTGSAITFINENGAGTITISIQTDTMRLAGAGTTGSRTLAANGIATAIKVKPTTWLISGTGLT